MRRESDASVMRKYVQNKSEIYGYVTGISFANQLGLTAQMPAVIEVVTNREATNGRMITVGSQRVRIKKPAITVSDSNAELLQLLDTIGQAEKYTELTIEETIEAFEELIVGAANELAIPMNVIEKDYIVTITLKALSEKLEEMEARIGRLEYLGA